MTVLRGLQSLRAIAALGVVLFHAASRVGAPVLVGQAGVDVFFVISGFIMWMLGARCPQPTPAAFMSDRLLRIVPLYWLATSVMLAGGKLHLFPNLVLTAPHTLASYFFIPWPSPSNGETWPLLVQGWTLNYEMLFYVLFALALLLPRSRQFGFVVGLLAMLAVAGLILRPTWAIGAFYTDPLLLEFAGGVCIGALWERGALPSKRWAIGLAVVGGLSFCAQAVMPIHAPRVLIYGVPAVLLVLGVIALEQAGTALTTPTLRLLGDASYSIYLFHTFAISLDITLFGRWGGVGVILVGLASGALAGVIAYLLVERPLIGLLADLRRRARRMNAPPMGGA